MTTTERDERRNKIHDRQEAEKRREEQKRQKQTGKQKHVKTFQISKLGIEIKTVSVRIS